MTERTSEEIKAYAEGYNDCYERFCECLKKRPIWKAIETMRCIVDAVNSAVKSEREE